MAPKRKSSPVPTIVKKRKTRFAFSVNKDIQLLKSVLEHNPFQCGIAKWKDVENDMVGLKWPVTARTAKERCLNLIQIFKKQALKAINKSGTEESYDERAHLIQEVLQLFEVEEQVIQVYGASPSDEECEENLDNDQTTAQGLFDAMTRQNVSFSPSPPRIPRTFGKGTATSEKNLLKLDKKIGDDERNKAKEALQSPDLTDCAPKRKDQRGKHLNKDALINERLSVETDLRKMQVTSDIEYKKKQLDLEERRLQLQEMESKRLSEQQKLFGMFAQVLERLLPNK